MQPDIQHAARRHKSGTEWGKDIVLSFFSPFALSWPCGPALIEKKNLIEALEETQATLKTEREAS